MNKSEEIINKYCDYIFDKYIKAGGVLKDADKQVTYWTLRGIYDREGKNSLDTFIKNWKPYIPKNRSVGYD